MADTNLNKIDLYEQTIAQTDTTQIDENSQYDIKDMPVGGITNAQMTLLTQSTHLGLIPIGSVFLCTNDKKFYKYLGTSWEEVILNLPFNEYVEKSTPGDGYETSFDNFGSYLIIKTERYSDVMSICDTETYQDTDGAHFSTIGTRSPNDNDPYYYIRLGVNGNTGKAYYTKKHYTYENGAYVEEVIRDAEEVATQNDLALKEEKQTTETYTIASNAWTALSSSEPFTYQTTVTATYTIGNDTEVGIINDQAVLFANYGFIVGSVSGQNVTIYAIAQPDASVSLTVGYRG